MAERDKAGRTVCVLLSPCCFFFLSPALHSTSLIKNNNSHMSDCGEGHVGHGVTLSDQQTRAVYGHGCAIYSIYNFVQTEHKAP